MCSLVRQSIGPIRSPGKFPGLLYALANKFAVFSQVYSTTGKQVSPPSSPSAALANFLYQPTLCLMQNFSPITYPSRDIGWLLCECELVYYFNSFTLTVTKIWEKITNFLLNNTEKKLIIWYYIRTFSKWPPKMWRLSGRLWNLNHRGSFGCYSLYNGTLKAVGMYMKSLPNLYQIYSLNESLLHAVCKL